MIEFSLMKMYNTSSILFLNLKVYGILLYYTLNALTLEILTTLI